MNTDNIYIERMSGSNSQFITVDRINNGITRRIGWNVLEQLLRNSDYLKPEEYVKAYKLNARCVEITIKNEND